MNAKTKPLQPPFGWGGLFLCVAVVGMPLFAKWGLVVLRNRPLFPWIVGAAVLVGWGTAFAVARRIEPPLPPREPPIERVHALDYRSVHVERIVSPAPRRSRAPAIIAWLGLLLTPIVALVAVALAAARGHFAVGFQAWLLAVPVAIAVPRAASRLLSGRLQATSIKVAMFALIGWAFLYALVIFPRGDDRYVSDLVFGWATLLTAATALIVGMLFGNQRLEGRLSS